jgi:6-phosphogluconolactonase
VDADTGALTLVQHQPTGKNPRHFAIDPTGVYCLVANQDSNEVVNYAIDPHTGQLTPTGRSVSVGAPVCVLPIIVRAPQPLLSVQATTPNTLSRWAIV